MAREKVTLASYEFNDAGFKRLIEQHNLLLAELDALYTKLNADAGVTDTNYGAAAATKAIE